MDIEFKKKNSCCKNEPRLGEGAWYLAVEGALVLRAEGAVQPLVARRWGGVELALTNTHEEEFFWTIKV